MRWSVLSLLLSLTLLIACDKSTVGPDKATVILPQTQAVVTWLKAVKDGDQTELRAVCSEKMQKRFDKEGWDNVVKTTQETFKNEFGDYKLEDITTFEFTGGEEEGKVSFAHKGKKFPGLWVIKEQNNWKINDR